MDIERFSDTQIGESTEDNSKLSVLVVDDSATMSEVMGHLLEHVGFSCQHAKNGVEAINLFLERDFDLVVTDLYMPKMDGYQLVQQITKVSKARKKLTRVLVTSSNNKKTTIVSFLSATRQSRSFIKLGYVVKPWGSGQFLHQIRNLFSEMPGLCSRIEKEIRECVEETNCFTAKNRLVLGVTEQGDGLRIEMGSDHHASMESDTINDYLEQLEENFFFSPVEHIICGVSQLDRQSSASTATLLLLMKGLADKHGKKVRFAGIGRELRAEIKKQGLEEVLGIYEFDSNRVRSFDVSSIHAVA